MLYQYWRVMAYMYKRRVWRETRATIRLVEKIRVLFWNDVHRMNYVRETRTRDPVLWWEELCYTTNLLFIPMRETPYLCIRLWEEPEFWIADFIMLMSQYFEKVLKTNISRFEFRAKIILVCDRGGFQLDSDERSSTFRGFRRAVTYLPQRVFAIYTIYIDSRPRGYFGDLLFFKILGWTQQSPTGTLCDQWHGLAIYGNLDFLILVRRADDNWYCSWLHPVCFKTADAAITFFKILRWPRKLKDGDAFCGDKPYKSQVTKILVDPNHARAWTETLRWYIVFFKISSSSSFGTAPKIEERGQVLRGQALQVPMLLIFTIMGTDSAGTSSAGPMNERVQFLKNIFWSCWIGKYHNVSKDYRLRIG